MEKTYPIEKFRVARIYREQQPLNFWQRMLSWFSNEIYSRNEKYHFDVEATVTGQVNILDIMRLENGVQFWAYNVEYRNNGTTTAYMKTIIKVPRSMMDRFPDVIKLKRRVND
jgi:lipopolysaccharide/colanic/teichoic acid biosynthesis glycosyltransferase